MDVLSEVSIVITHIIQRDKFTNGYIKFMRDQFPEKEFVFFTRYGEYAIDSDKEDTQIIEVENYSEIIKNSEYYEIIRTSNKIIVSGVFLTNREIINFVFLGLFFKNNITKTYFHFWGGDFYCFRNKKRDIKYLAKKQILYKAFSESAGLIFLIPDEYERFVEITGIEKKNYVAPMPEDPNHEIHVGDYRQNRTGNHEPVRIIVGNSATETNRHADAFEALKRFPFQKMEIYAPLSYGNEDYRDKIIKEGNRIFGERFQPVLRYMDIEDYTRFLASMDIGIFANDRQQAMGNISKLLGLGAKVYLRDDTSMWKSYRDEGNILFRIESICSMEFDEFINFEEKDRKVNEMIADGRDSLMKAKEAWTIVFSGVDCPKTKILLSKCTKNEYKNN